jgi:hypothetical protein
MSVRAAVSAESSAPMSKSASWMRIIAAILGGSSRAD